MRRRRRLWLVVLTGLLSLIVGLVYAAWPGRSTFTVSPETTYVTGPIDKHGYVDYVTALNERLRGNITPEKNANVLIWQALGPRPEGGNGMPPEYFEWLGIDEPPEQGDYFVDYESYLKIELNVERGWESTQFDERRLIAMKSPWTATDNPELANWLRRIEKPLSLLIEASRRPDYYNPLVPRRSADWSYGLFDVRLPNVQRCREVAAALSSRAMLRTSEGKIEAAWHDLLACHRLGRHLAHGGTGLEWLAGFAIEKVASNADVAFLVKAQLSSKQILECLRELQSLPPMPTVAQKVDLGERIMYLDTLMLAVSQGVPFLDGMKRGRMETGSVAPAGNRTVSSLFTRNINWDPAFRNVNRWCDRFVAASSLTDFDERKREMAAIEQDLGLLKESIRDASLLENVMMGPTARGEMIGNILIGLFFRAVMTMEPAGRRCVQTQRNLRLAFALAAYRRDHGKYPTALADLAPKYLDAIPDDLFSGEPLIYRPTETSYLLYSVGPNGNDDEGRSTDDEPRGDDLTVRVPAPEPRGKR